VRSSTQEPRCTGRASSLHKKGRCSVDSTICDEGFTDWLLEQRRRDDAVGDLARDFAMDDAHCDARDLEHVVRGRAWDAFERAVDEYRAYADLAAVFA
jgi:hypothetical protein